MRSTGPRFSSIVEGALKWTELPCPTCDISYRRKIKRAVGLKRGDRLTSTALFYLGEESLETASSLTYFGLALLTFGRASTTYIGGRLRNEFLPVIIIEDPQ